MRKLYAYEKSQYVINFSTSLLQCNVNEVNQYQAFSFLKKVYY